MFRLISKLLFITMLASGTALHAQTIKVPVRWCGVEGSPSMIDPGLVGEVSQKDVLWRRHERVSDDIYTPQCLMTFRSGATAAIPNFPVNIPDPDLSLGNPGDVCFDVNPNDSVVCPADEFLTLINACRAAWRSLEPRVVGITAVHINRFVDTSGNASNVVGLGGVGGFSDTHLQNVIGRAMVIDNAYTLPGSPMLLFEDPVDKFLGHEFGHALTLNHGDGIDDDGDGDIDEQDEFETVVGSNLMQYDPNGLELTSFQCFRMRTQSLLHIPDRVVDPVTPPLSNFGVDLLGDLEMALPPGTDAAFADIDTTGIAEDTETAQTRMYLSTVGRFSTALAALSPGGMTFYFLLDLDGNPSTGGEPATLGIPTAFQGAELVGILTVDGSGVNASESVFSFGGGAFMPVSNPAIASSVQEDCVGLYQVPPFFSTEPVCMGQIVEITVPSSLGNPQGMSARMESISSIPSGVLDRSDVQLAFEIPDYPNCNVMPASASPGQMVDVVATGLPGGMTAHVLLGALPVATGLIDGGGNFVGSFVIPADSKRGERLVTVGAGDTAITADCTVNVRVPEIPGLSHMGLLVMVLLLGGGASFALRTWRPGL